MPRWIKELYVWLVKEGYPLNDMILYSIPRQKGRFCYRPKPGNTWGDERRRFWYIGLKYEMPLKDFIKQKI